MKNLKVRLIVGGACTAHDASLMMYEAMAESIASNSHGRVAVGRIYYVMRSGEVRLTEVNIGAELPTVDKLEGGRALTVGEYLSDLASEESFVFSLLQGTDGEDGVYQGALKVANVLSNLGPVFPAALSRHKWSQSLAAEFICPDLKPIRTARLRHDATWAELGSTAARFKIDDVVVKPNDLGGSVHTKILQNVTADTLQEYLHLARGFTDEFLVQDRIVGAEYTVGCMRVDGKTVVLPVAEVQVDSGFLGFTEKWADVGFKVRILPEEHWVSKRLGAMSAKLFDQIGFGTACRFDYIVAGEDVYFLEVNSKPGLCRDSFFTIMLAEAGMTLCDFLILSHADAVSQWRRTTFINYRDEFTREAKERSETRLAAQKTSNRSIFNAAT